MTEQDEQAVSMMLYDLNSQHRMDKDGGYALVRAVVALLRRQTDNERAIIRKVLVHQVDSEDAKLWGVALEALIEDATPDTAPLLEESLTTRRHSKQWDEQVILALLRLNYKEGLNLYTSYISDRLKRWELAPRNSFVLVLLAHLVKIDASLCIEMASVFLGERLTLEEQKEVIEKYVPAFVMVFVAKDENLLLDLINKTKVVNRDAGRELAHMIYEYLGKPWVSASLGHDKVSLLRTRVAQELCRIEALG